MKSIDRPSSGCSSRTRLSIEPWIETSSAEVISSAMSTCGPAGERAGERDALALPARHAWPGTPWRATASRCTSSSSRATSSLRSARLSPRGRISAMLAPIVMRGSSEEYGSWNTICSGRGRVCGDRRAVEEDAAAR